MTEAISTSDNYGLPNPIIRKMVELRKEVGYLEPRKVDGVSYKVKSASELMGYVRAAADKVGLLIVPTMANIENIPMAVNQKGQQVLAANVVLKLTFISVPDGDSLTVQGVGTGVDVGDKAAGKAATYAWKSILIQTLLLANYPVDDADDTDDPAQQKVVPAKKGTDVAKGGTATAPAKAAPSVTKAIGEVITQLRACTTKEALFAAAKPAVEAYVAANNQQDADKVRAECKACLATIAATQEPQATNLEG